MGTAVVTAARGQLWCALAASPSALFRSLPKVRVYTKPKGKLPDFNDPVVLPRSKAT